MLTFQQMFQLNKAESNYTVPVSHHNYTGKTENSPIYSRGIYTKQRTPFKILTLIWERLSECCTKTLHNKKKITVAVPTIF